MTTGNPFVPVFFVAWILLGAGGMWWISRIANPAAKRSAIRRLTVLTAIVFATFAWLITRSTQQLLFFSPFLVLITYLNLTLLKVCDNCASICRPQGFTAPIYCQKCGATLSS
jgi:hypothetical protein